ncbi:B3 domain-containing protein [Quillaja saponaria]|uniref:B3 domain-containing protein n=1 Tax=Quillaja saponaria TaxID=32244 RepID=A0AAD7PKH4_QUISA|nr:B3 domain-containing protein [Quillaja saponaria]
MGETCRNSRASQEEIYWNHFKLVRFTQFLGSGYHEQLALPKKFSDYMKKKLPENVTLKGSSGLVWDVQLTTMDDTLFFTHGWQQFVKDHCLEETDFLNFTYNGDTQFDVSIVNRESLCEKEASYFVQKSEHTERESGGPSKQKQEISLEEVHTPSNAGVGHIEPEKSRDALNVQSRVVPFEDANKGTLKLASSGNHVQTKMKGQRIESSRGVTSQPAEPTSTSKTRTYSELYRSNRRPVTENEKTNALQLAEKASSTESINIIMRPTHVFKRFFVSLPTSGTMKYLSAQNQDVILRIGMDTWSVRYSY